MIYSRKVQHILSKFVKPQPKPATETCVPVLRHDPPRYLVKLSDVAIPKVSCDVRSKESVKIVINQNKSSAVNHLIEKVSDLRFVLIVF